MNLVLGAKIRLVSGYPGMPGVILALQRGEVSGACGVTAAALRTRLAESLNSGQIKLLVQLGGTPTSEFKANSVFDYARSDEARELINYFFGTLTLGRLIAAPPGVPEERLAALRTAFGSVVQDSTLLEEANKWASAADLQKQMDELSKHPHEFFEKVQKSR